MALERGYLQRGHWAEENIRKDVCKVSSFYFGSVWDLY